MYIDRYIRAEKRNGAWYASFRRGPRAAWETIGPFTDQRAAKRAARYEIEGVRTPNARPPKVRCIA